MVSLDVNKKGSSVVLSNNNMTAYIPARQSVFVTKPKSSGKWYWEIKYDVETGTDKKLGVGIGNVNGNINDAWQYPNYGYYYANDGKDYGIQNTGSRTYGDTFTVGDVIGVLLDVDNKKIEFRVNGKSQSQIPYAINGEIYPYIARGGQSGSITATIKLRKKDFSYDVPNGYRAYELVNKTLILHNSEYKTFNEFVDKVNPIKGARIPNTLMQSFASSSFIGSGNDSSKVTGSGGWISSSGKTTNEWVQVNLSERKDVYSFTISGASGTTSVLNMPKDFKLQGSNNNSDWDDLGYWTNVTNWENGVSKEFFPTTYGEYERYRIFVEQSNGTNYICVAALTLYQVDYTEIKRIDIETVSTTTPTQEQFLSHGMDSLSPLLDRVNGISPLDNLTGDFEIFTWTDEDDATEVLEMNVAQSPQLVYPTKDISLAGVETVDSIKLTATGNAKVAVSFDSELTWKAYKNGVWITVADAHDGMTASEINALTGIQIAEARGDSEFVRFSYSLTDNAEVNQIEVRVTMQGTEQIAKTSDYEVDYDSVNKTIVYKIKKSGTYSFNYIT